MSEDPTIAIIPTRNRHKMLLDCVHSVVNQVDRVLVIDNESEPRISFELDDPKVEVIRYECEPPNISELWNMGISYAEQHLGVYPRWNVAIFNSDVIVPPVWVSHIARMMRQTTAVLAYSGQHNVNQLIMHSVPGPVDLRTRITGFAFMLRGEADLRLDETMKWWYSDDDLDWRARKAGGSLMVPGIPVYHREPNGSTNARLDLQEQAGKDRQTFINKWGMVPH